MTEEQNLVYDDPNIKRHDFPHEFMFGVGTSAYQVEGAWNDDRKGLHIWDCFTLRRPENIEDGSNACVTIDNYYRMKEDVQLLKKMGVSHYRFSISWARILPGGKVSMGKNLEGINHYNKLIDELKANDIEPFVTLFHWDLPNALEEEYMDFLSSKIVDDFVNYAEICFWEFGDRVKNWVTLNEPYRFAFAGYVEGNFAPGRGGKNQDGDPETEPYIVTYNLLNCHAAAYRKYQEDFKDAQKGQVGITLDTSYFKPYHKENQDDHKAVEYAYDFMFGWKEHSQWLLYIIKTAITPSRHHPEGRHLPVFTDEQKCKLVQSYDFLGINYYTANYAQKYNYSSSLSNGFLDDCHYKATGAPQKNDDKKTYEEVRDDAFRLKYIKLHLDAIKRANIASEKSITRKPLVMGYFAWSFTDSFEWCSGYTLRFGMNYVDYKNNLLRYPKNSSVWFKKFLSKNKLHETRKRRLVDVEQEDEVMNGALVKDGQAIEVVQKLKKAKT